MKEGGLMQRVAGAVDFLTKGYTQEELETAQKYATGELTAEDREAYRTKRINRLGTSLFMSTPAYGLDGISAPDRMRTFLEGLNALTALTDGELEEQMRREGMENLKHWKQSPQMPQPTAQA